MIRDKDLQSIQEVRDYLEQAKSAQDIVGKMSQSEIDQIVESMANAGRDEAERLATMAVEETGFGKVADKVVKNLFAANDVYNAIKDMKTVGIINRDEQNRVWEIAQPVGIVAGIVPSTNPTSTAIFKSLIAVKGRNAIIFSPHPSAAKCTAEAVKIMQEAAERAGAPKGLISCITQPTLPATNELMKHKFTKVILATGGSAMVLAAYSSGKPAYGVGPGNVPSYIHESADLEKAARLIVESKNFDYGTICASEQALVVDQSIKEKFIFELKKQGAYFLDENEKQKVVSVIMVNGRLNANQVGRSPQKIGEIAGIEVPSDAKVLVAEETNVGKEYPVSIEKLSPVLAFYTVKDKEEASGLCGQILAFGGLGHTLGIHCNDDKVVEEFTLDKPVSRIVVNGGTTFGGIGATTAIFPSLTLGCGAIGNNISSDNIGAKHMINIKRVAYAIREMPKQDEVSQKEHALTK
ncbi:acetaldehyde dehydrogenase (acetylating) [Bacillus methanolicus]|uniref:Aldehyde-alcohol dehydrogenase n=1 Tax=Bacillus methanolicus (strain MGA3 / ATCC 53907) TaxID=796606 RepID=I3E348_BACMM|nr:acetaldehyde dehydrogenase (acetylating) [Bacillus methanolicus]AIE58986.1 Aldehyde-alcohol dehydrogenase [Bacillus methanolicus MGA3]EIJ80919.1 acetaldehyde dehydrogenase (acetylating) [Bacillus methanolicus MGA3]